VDGRRTARGKVRPTELAPEIRAFVDTNWLGEARMAEEEMGVMVNEKFGTGFARRTLRMWRNTLKTL
jgi:hypothetical protein